MRGRASSVNDTIGVCRFNGCTMHICHYKLLIIYILIRVYFIVVFDLYEQKLKNISVDDLKTIIHSRNNAYLIVDAREVESYCKGHIPGACDAFDAEIESLAAKMDKNAHVIVYGPGQWVKSENPADRLSGDAAIRLMKLGFKNVMELNGGLEAWADAGHRVDMSDLKKLKLDKTMFKKM
jgi:rhodanese-related sulfurtransferase